MWDRFVCLFLWHDWAYPTKPFGYKVCLRCEKIDNYVERMQQYDRKADEIFKRKTGRVD